MFICSFDLVSVHVGSMSSWLCWALWPLTHHGSGLLHRACWPLRYRLLLDVDAFRHHRSGEDLPSLQPWISLTSGSTSIRNWLNRTLHLLNSLGNIFRLLAATISWRSLIIIRKCFIKPFDHFVFFIGVTFILYSVLSFLFIQFTCVHYLWSWNLIAFGSLQFSNDSSYGFWWGFLLLANVFV